jgi:hypothetical protein
MRNYKIYYYAEINDECVDLEESLQANNIVDAIMEFNTFGIISKRIYKIKEF